MAMRDHESLCRQSSPDMPAIARVRWRIAEASRRRLEYFVEEVLPQAEAHAASDAVRCLQTIKDRTAGYRQRISAYLADWPTEKIADDWQGYRAAAMLLRRTIHARLEDEAMIMRLVALPEPVVTPDPSGRRY